MRADGRGWAHADAHSGGLADAQPRPHRHAWPKPTGTPTFLPTDTPQPTATFPPNVYACRAAALSLDWDFRGVGSGHDASVYTLTNVSHVTCYLYGYIDLAFRYPQGAPCPSP